MTSQNVVSYVKRVLAVSKAGHTGTLDPGAAGVLPIVLGKATRISEYLINDKKAYRAEMMLGYKSDTLDKYGNVNALEEPLLDEDDIYKAFDSFKGRIEQLPPMYSAVKHNGERLYALARQGIEIERKKREAYIFDLNIIKVDGNMVLFDVTCSKGTYIRSLCSDIGKSLGSDAVMTFLIRTKTGPFTIDNAVTLDELKDTAEKGLTSSILYPIHSAIEGCSSVFLAPVLSRKVKNGVGFNLVESIEYDEASNTNTVLIFDENREFIAVGRISSDKYVIIDKVFA